MVYQDKRYKTLRQKLRNDPTDAERKLWSVLRKNQILGYKFTRQYGVGSYVLDFYCSKLKLAIELDDSQHMQDAKQIYDDHRTQFINKHNIQVLRIYNNEIFNNLEGVVDKIIQIIKSSQISPSNSPL